TSAGLPLEIRSNVPLPPALIGEHRLTFVIESPRVVAAPAVSINAAATDVTRLAIVSPLDGDVVDAHPRIRWSLVPGASGYELDVSNGAGHTRVRTTQTSWGLDNLPRGRTRVRVRAIFAGDVRGEPTAWSTLTVSSTAEARLDDN